MAWLVLPLSLSSLTLPRPYTCSPPLPPRRVSLCFCVFPPKSHHGNPAAKEVIPALLHHLAVPHVSVACHSGGTISGLDLLLHHPHLLRPGRAYLALGGPWIQPAHTASRRMALVSALPCALVGRFDSIARLANAYVAPVGAAVARLVPSSATRHPDPEREGASREDALLAHAMRRAFAEGVRGLGADALLFMRKVPGAAAGGWGDWGDYDTLAPRLAEALRAAGVGRLTLDVFFAEEDVMVGDAGTKGPMWFDGIWKGDDLSDVINYNSRVVEGTDHDSIWSLRWGVPQTVIEMVGQLGGSEGKSKDEVEGESEALTERSGQEVEEAKVAPGPSKDADAVQVSNEA
jgi:hypothetical protein